MSERVEWAVMHRGLCQGVHRTREEAEAHCNAAEVTRQRKRKDWAAGPPVPWSSPYYVASRRVVEWEPVESA